MSQKRNGILRADAAVAAIRRREQPTRAARYPISGGRNASPTYRYDPNRTPPALVAALEIIAEDFPVRPARSARTADVRLRFDVDGPRCVRVEGRVEITGGTVPQVLRALATLRGWAGTGHLPQAHAERAYFDTLGLMLDASRNAVPTVATVKFLLRRMALMGLNLFMLYTEDTYEVPGQPMIGHFRGRYTQAELREIGAYAAKLGIEVIPCIQTLGHLQQMLRWPAFAAVRDTAAILLVDEPRTYRLLEEMLAAASAPFRSRRIHIGMDEAHELGLGNDLHRHGFRPRFELMNRHLRRVVAITNRLGLRPMIWSDMYFRLGSKTGDYYDPKTRISSATAAAIPRSVQLVYWDYYHAGKEFDRDWIDRHRALGKEPIFAGGLWTWGCFWANFGKARLGHDSGLAACKERSVREAFTTAWGDDGTEIDLRSLLPGLQHFAEHGFGREVTMAQLSRQFRATTGSDLDVWLRPAQLDDLPFVESMRSCHRRSGFPITPSMRKIGARLSRNWVMANPSKYLLWQDPLLGLYDAHIQGLPVAQYYAMLADQLRAARKRHPSASRSLRLPLSLAKVLADKAELGLRLRQLYQAGNRRALARLRDRDLPALLRQVRRLHDTHRAVWFELYKPHGWEVLDIRYGGLLVRLHTVRRRVDDFLQGQTAILQPSSLTPLR